MAPGGTQKREAQHASNPRPSPQRQFAELLPDLVVRDGSLSLYAARSTVSVARPVGSTLRSVPTSQQRVFSVLMARETIRVQDCSAADGTAVLIRASR